MVHDIIGKVTASLASCLTAAVLVSCSGGNDDGGSGDTSTASSGQAETIPVTDALGDVEVPAEAEHIIALDELSGVAALSLGKTPSVVYASLGDSQSAEILRGAGVEVRDVEVLSLPSNEELLDESPDLIVAAGKDAPAGSERDDLTQIAATAIIDIEGAWADITASAAAVFNAEEAGQRQIDAVQALLDASADDSARPETLALVGFTTEPFTMPPHSPSSTLIRDAGFERPEAEREENNGYSSPFSLENLQEHDAELIVIPEGEGYPSDEITSSSISGGLTGTAVHPSAQQWFGNSPFAFWVVAKDLRTLASGSTDVLEESEIPALWEEFMEEVAP